MHPPGSIQKRVVTIAERRMFAKTIIDSDAFLDMPLSTQALYFHLSMRADDDGFINNPKKIQRMIGCNDDDLKLLIAKRFIIPFDSGVCVIKHWLVHNLIRKDRYKETVYTEEKQQLSIKGNGTYTTSDVAALPVVNQVATSGEPDENQRLTQDRLGKVRVGKDRIGQDRSDKEGDFVTLTDDPPDDERPASPAVPYEQIKSMYNSICVSLPKCTAMSDARKKAIRARISSGYTLEDFERLFTKTEASGFMKGANSRNWRANFDWLLKDANMAKVLDGNYDDHPTTYNPQTTNVPTSGLDRLMAKIQRGDYDE